MRKLRDHVLEENIAEKKTVAMMFLFVYIRRIAEVQNINGKIKKIEFLLSNKKKK